MTLSLFDEPPVVPEHRVETLTRVIAGFRWPGRESFGKLTKAQQTACRNTARAALERLAAEPD